MNAQIGQLIRNGNAVFYAHIGTERTYTEGTVEQLEAALEGKEIPVAPKAAAKEEASKEYNVRLTFQYPAWDEKEGILYTGILAKSKAQAIEQARKMAFNDGHTSRGNGRVTFKTEE